MHLGWIPSRQINYRVHSKGCSVLEKKKYIDNTASDVKYRHYYAQTTSQPGKIFLNYKMSLLHWRRIASLICTTYSAPNHYLNLYAGLLSIGPLEINFNAILIKIQMFRSWKVIGKCLLQNGGHFASALMCLTVANLAKSRSSRTLISDKSFEKSCKVRQW